MHYLVLATIMAVMLCNYLVSLGLLPSLLKLLPEVLSAFAAIFVVVAGMVHRFRFVRAPYWLVFGTLGVIMLFGAIINEVEPGPLVAGMRSYLRAIPFFLLPAIYVFKDWQIRQQLRLLLCLALVQLPIAAFQRMSLFQSQHWSGDKVFGTLMISSVLSMFLICAACVAMGFFLRKRLSTRQFVILFFLLLIPTTINETKGTLLLLPIALFTTLMVGCAPGKRLRIGLSAVALLATFGAIYVPAYNYFSTQNNPYPFTLAQFFSDEGRMQRYLDKGATVGTRGAVGRVDAVTVPLALLSKDSVDLAFGLGIGNASESSLGPQFTGKYFPTLGNYAQTTSAGTFLLEIGVLGTFLVLLLYWLIFSDARTVARRDDGLMGALAIGWTGATALLAVATFYKTTHTFEPLSYLFWYFAGLIAARRMQLAINASPSTPASMASIGTTR